MSYIDPREIERIKQIDLLTYLMCNDPNELIKCSAREYSTRTHDSLKISNGRWHQFSKGIGGKNALDYLIKIKDMTFLDAVRVLQSTSSSPIHPLPIEATKVSANVKENFQRYGKHFL